MLPGGHPPVETTYVSVVWYGNPLDADSIFERTHEPILFLGESH